MTDQVSSAGNSVKKVCSQLQANWGKGDLYRDTPIRLLGYANEVGEAFRAWVPVSAVKATYVVAFGYVIADALDKTQQVYKKPFESVSERQKKLGITLLDTLTWQTFASVVIPGITINRLVATTNFTLKKGSKMAPTSIKLFSTFLGLVAIPFIVRPIDTLVEMTMENSIRKLYR